MDTRDQILGTVLERTDSKGPVTFGEGLYKSCISVGVSMWLCAMEYALQNLPSLSKDIH